jgi:hypothetical protein
LLPTNKELLEKAKTVATPNFSTKFAKKAI